MLGPPTASQPAWIWQGRGTSHRLAWEGISSTLLLTLKHQILLTGNSLYKLLTELFFIIRGQAIFTLYFDRYFAFLL